MQFRKQFGAAALIATAALAGCSGRDEPGEEPDAGCTGVCSTDAGTDAGTQPNNCPAPVNGLGPIGQLKATGVDGQQKTFNGLVVIGIDFVNTPNAQGQTTTQFWAVDPCFPKEGLFLDRFRGNPNATYQPAVGDVVTVDGLFRRYSSTGANTPVSRVSYRPVLKDNFGLTGVSGSLTVTKTGTAPLPPDYAAPSGFGNAQGGAAKPNPEVSSARVHIPGPVSITNAKPLALKGRPFEPEHSLYLGFEVSGGVLVLNDDTFRNCDWRQVVLDGGTVTFNNGIRGVWDTYTNVQCAEVVTTQDGGTSCSSYADGGVPGVLSDGGVGMINDYTYVLQPLDCAKDLTP